MIKSGHGVGKSAFLSWAALWWLMTRTPAKIGVTAPSAHQLNDVLWSEMQLWRMRLPEGLKQEILLTSEKMYLTSRPELNFAVARTARKEQPEALQGFHSANQLFLVDEASGVDDVIFQVGEGSMTTPGSKMVLTGNPTRTTGYFFRAFHKNRERWYNMTVSVLDLIERGVPYADPSFPEAIAGDYGLDSNVYKVRVLGEFPTSEDDVVIPLHLVEEATKRSIEPSGTYRWGLDVARFGDDRTALAKRRGNVVREKIRFWRGKDLMQTVGLVKAEYDQERIKPDEILVDVIGMGSGVVDRLRELGLPVRGVNVAESAAVKDKYMRQRDELWFECRDWLSERSCQLPDQDALIAELTSPKYEITSTGKLKVESKDDMKKRGMLSPDLADALLLTFAPGGNRNFWKPLEYKDTPYYV